MQGKITHKKLSKPLACPPKHAGMMMMMMMMIMGNQEPLQEKVPILFFFFFFFPQKKRLEWNKTTIKGKNMTRRTRAPSGGEIPTLSRHQLPDNICNGARCASLPAKARDSTSWRT